MVLRGGNGGVPLQLYTTASSRPCIGNQGLNKESTLGGNGVLSE